LERLDFLARERGQSRSRAVEALLEAHRTAPQGFQAGERALQLLSESAEQGSVTARVQLAKLLMAEAKETAPASEDDPFDAAAKQQD
jgi:hypothetical protein